MAGFQTTEGYSTIKVTGLPSVSNLMVRITLKNNRFDVELERLILKLVM